MKPRRAKGLEAGGVEEQRQVKSVRLSSATWSRVDELRARRGESISEFFEAAVSLAAADDAVADDAGQTAGGECETTPETAPETARAAAELDAARARVLELEEANAALSRKHESLLESYMKVAEANAKAITDHAEAAKGDTMAALMQAGAVGGAPLPVSTDTGEVASRPSFLRYVREYFRR